MKRSIFIIAFSIYIGAFGIFPSFAISSELLNRHWAEKIIREDFVNNHCKYLYDKNNLILTENEKMNQGDFIISLYSILNKEYPQNKQAAMEYFISKEIIQKNQIHMDKTLDRKTVVLWIMNLLRQENHIKNTKDIQNPFTDLNQLDDEHKKSILEAYNCGLISGYLDDTFKPNESITKIQAVILLQKLEDKLKMGENKIPFHIIDKQYTNSDLKDDMIINEEKEKVNITIFKCFPTPGYNMDIKSIQKNKNGNYNIYIDIEKPAPNVLLAQVITSQLITIEVNKKDLGESPYKFDIVNEDERMLIPSFKFK